MTPAAVFVGAMLGMLLMGRLGDTLGRTRALQVRFCKQFLKFLPHCCWLGMTSMTDMQQSARYVTVLQPFGPCDR